MAFILTTLSAACGVNDQTITVASLTSLTAGMLVAIDKEIVKLGPIPAAATTPITVSRGQEGTANQAHVTSAQVKAGATPTSLSAGDWQQPVAGAPSAPGGAAPRHGGRGAEQT